LSKVTQSAERPDQARRSACSCRRCPPDEQTSRRST
jgi:hypothetical protein